MPATSSGTLISRHINVCSLTKLNFISYTIHTYTYIYIYNIMYMYVCMYVCMISTSDLPDMYAQSLSVAGLRAEGIHIRQITSAYVTTNM